MVKEFKLNDILTLENRYRATFINSLGGFKSLALIGTRNGEGISNLAIFNSLFHIGANPPLFGFIVRPDSVERHTLSNILETGEFTVNHVREDFFEQAHQTSARYSNNVSEFEATN
ncbi:MAG: flavin reductase, partial [Bacteroidia bacterium]